MLASLRLWDEILAAAASSSVAKGGRRCPHLIYFPERTFNRDQFLQDVANLYSKYGGIIVVV